MDLVKEAAAVLQQLQREFAQRAEGACWDSIAKLQKHIAAFSVFQAASLEDSALVRAELSVARETLQIAVFLAAMTPTGDQFERYYGQLKPLYTDFTLGTRVAATEHVVTGLNLLRLLAENRIADFHTQLELLPPAVQESPVAHFAIELEQHLMEGNYKKVIAAGANPPSPYCVAYAAYLVNHVARERIAECIEEAYPRISMQGAMKLLMLKSEAEVEQCVQGRGWTVSMDGDFVFGASQEASRPPVAISSQELLVDLFGYAKELERIV